MKPKNLVLGLIALIVSVASAFASLTAKPGYLLVYKVANPGIADCTFITDICTTSSGTNTCRVNLTHTGGTAEYPLKESNCPSQAFMQLDDTEVNRTRTDIYQVL